MNKLSICILTYNEEKHLPRLLDQLAALRLDTEILVFDSFSSDATEFIAKSHKDIRFVQNRFENFAAQRNAAINEALGDWIFMLDADEILSDTLIGELCDKTYENGLFEIYDIPRKNYFLGKWIRGTWPDPQRRLFKKDPRFRYSSDVHETISTGEPVGRTIGHLEHLTVGFGVTEWVRKMNLYTDKGSKNPKKIGVFGLVSKPSILFAYFYFYKRGYRDGIVGFIYAVMVWIYEFIENTKKYEKSLTEKYTSIKGIDDIEISATTYSKK